MPVNTKLLWAILVTLGALALVACGEARAATELPDSSHEGGEESLLGIAALFTKVGSWCMGLSVVGFIAMLVFKRNPLPMALCAGAGWLCLAISYVFRFMAEHFWPLTIAAILVAAFTYFIMHRKGWLKIKVKAEQLADDLKDDGKLNSSHDDDEIETEIIEKGR